MKNNMKSLVYLQILFGVTYSFPAISNDNQPVCEEDLDNKGCSTIAGATPNLPCIFPFKHKNATFYTCAHEKYVDETWCSTKVDDNGNHITGHWGDCDPACHKGCHVVELRTRQPKPCIFPFGRIINGKPRFFNKCTDIYPDNPSGMLMCSTKVNETTGMHINGYGYWGLCEEELCPAHKGCKQLPPCPYRDPTETNSLTVRSNEDFVPGVTCKPLPTCPKKSEPQNDDLVPGVTCIPAGELPSCPYEDPSKLVKVRNNDDFVPGITCIPLPNCPYVDPSKQLDIRNNEDLVPGVTCIPLPECSDEPLSNKKVPGVTCIPKEPEILPFCPQGIDFRNQKEWIPGKNCELINVTPKPAEDTESTPLPLCPQGIDFRSQSEWVPGKNCKIVKPISFPDDPGTRTDDPIKLAATVQMKVDDFMHHKMKETVPTYPPKEKWRANATPDQIKLVDSARERGCRSSLTNEGGKHRYGQLNTTCQFPFTVKGKMYYTCTWDYSHTTDQNPWCSVDTDENNKHHGGKDRVVIDGIKKKFYGICDDTDACNIPPRLPGEPKSSRPLPEEDDRDNDVSSAQVPWMTSLGGFKTEENWDHQCGGSLVTEKHILTAAHCIDLTKNEYIHGPQMRLGTADMTDASKGTLRNIIEFRQHPKYISTRAYYDVAIAVANIPIDFTDFIRPVSLPMQPIDDENAFEDELVTLSGWGLEVGEQQYKPRTNFKLVTIAVNSKEYCEEEIFGEEALKAAGIPPFKLKRQLPRGFTNDITCVGNEFDEDSTSCEGDSGSPVIRRISNTAIGYPYYQQEYVVSTGLDCNLKATIYARVSNREILTWIQEVTDTHPLVVVMGGFTTVEEVKRNKFQQKVVPGPTTNVEIISKNRKCQKGMAPINLGSKKVCDAACQGKSPDDPTLVPFTFSEADVFRHTAQFTNDAPIQCGGITRKDHVNDCYEYDYKTNKWYIIPGMTEKRIGASSVLDKNGNMWVLGGSANSSASDSTEIYEYRPSKKDPNARRTKCNQFCQSQTPDNPACCISVPDLQVEDAGHWRKGFPLPIELRDTGIAQTCTVKINSTHIFMAGGYARDFEFSESLDNTKDEDYYVDVSALTDNAGSLLIRSASDPLPRCYSIQHREIGIFTNCIERQPICDSEEHRWAEGNGIRVDCRDPICGSEEHKSKGLETECTPPLCNSPDHELVGLDRECIYICDSEEHKAAGLTTGCRKLKDGESGIYNFGSTIANAWMYDGDVWNRIKPLSAPREDHMCSLVQTDEGVKIIVAGGCNGWCAESPPITTAELYDPKTDTWTKLPDLPFPISAGRMEQLNGKPTIIGGRTQFPNTPPGKVEQSNLLISYNYRTNTWNMDGKINLPRSSHAVMQIPKTFIPVCFF